MPQSVVFAARRHHGRASPEEDVLTPPLIELRPGQAFPLTVPPTGRLGSC
ncbi:hypothetical protein [Arthrobacter sp. GMC3]|nr:hypothetical protein [Arthrobacter sp. GMC3]